MKKEKKENDNKRRKLDNENQPPLLVGLLGVHECQSFVDNIMSHDDLKTHGIDSRQMYVLSKTRFKLIQLDPAKFDECLDIVKNLDILLIIYRPNQLSYDQDSDTTILLRAIHIHCLPTIVHVLYLDKAAGGLRQVIDAKRALRSRIKDDKVICVEKSQDFVRLFNEVGNCKRLRSHFKESRTIIDTDETEVIADQLTFKGFIRHRRLSPNNLIHVVGFGDYQISQIDVLPDVVSLRESSLESSKVIQTLLPDPMRQETLEQENDLDPMEGEQTWPTAEELTTESEYRNTEEQGDDVEMEEASECSSSSSDPTDDIPARLRYAKYRGLNSFRTSSWDPKENLPTDYNKIFQFQNFHQTRRRVMKEIPDIGVDPGLYVRVHVKDVPQEFSKAISGMSKPPTLVGLLPYEKKMTVMNYLIKRLPDDNHDDPIKSKDELLFYVGYRKFLSRPIFSNHGIASKFKSERFLRDDVAMVATLYAPITFTPAPVLVFRIKPGKQLEMVASGSVLDSNPNRLIIKRIQLSGNPFKIHSKTAVIRSMFYNSEDIMYFKPVELTTRYNRRGHITEPLGTHGHMKCVFDKRIRSDDCIFMNLYKRVFPKWAYIPIYNI